MTSLHPDLKTPPLDERSLMLRRMIVRTMMDAGRGHLGASMSLVEIMRVLYDDILVANPRNPAYEQRDRCILSKGHGCLAQYVMLADLVFFDKAELSGFCGHDHFLGGHPERGIIPGVEASTGALGHGPSIGVGLAKAAKLKGQNHRVFVVVGDGESQEGAVWEAALSAAKNKLDNLCIIIDYNKLQSYNAVCEVSALAPLADKWQSFGFDVHEVDGHNVTALKNKLSALPYGTGGKPFAVVAHTVKGKGIDIAEDNPMWHHKSRLKDHEAQAVTKALGEV